MYCGVGSVSGEGENWEGRYFLVVARQIHEHNQLVCNKYSVRVGCHHHLGKIYSDYIGIGILC
jgi:hypothetical protein